MNLDQYVQDAIRTESKIDKVTISDDKLFLSTLKIFIASGTILDMFKKNVFYGKEIDSIKTYKLLNTITEEKCRQMLYKDKGEEITLDVDPRIFHALIGTATEATELMEALEAGIEGEDIDYVNVMEEFGDINWYEAIGCDATEVSFEDILITNIEKLRKRFPERFTNEEAIERNLDEERNILEKGLDR